MVGCKYPIIKILSIMRNAFIFLLLFCAVFVKAQEYDLSLMNHTQANMSVYFAVKDNTKLQEAYKQTPYWKRYKVLKGCAWGALGLGICGTGVTGFIMVVHGSYSGSESSLYTALLITSLGVTASSIPLFIFANKNKIKAKRTVELSLNASHIYMSLPNGRQQVEPALGLCINF